MRRVCIFLDHVRGIRAYLSLAQAPISRYAVQELSSMSHNEPHATQWRLALDPPLKIKGRARGKKLKTEWKTTNSLIVYLPHWEYLPGMYMTATREVDKMPEGTPSCMLLFI